MVKQSDSKKKNHGKTLLSEMKFYTDYSKWLPLLERKETWEEAVKSVMDVHRGYYKDKMSTELTEAINFAEKMYIDKKVLGSQRTLQFREGILKHSSRQYNCTVSYVDRLEFFSEAFYLLLCGCGVGFSVLNKYITCLPKLIKRVEGTKTYKIEDSIEGWANSLACLLSSYSEKPVKGFEEYQGYEIKFDFSLIRPKGAFISGGFKAPGSDGLKKSLEKIEILLNKHLEHSNLYSSIIAYDIVMHSSDAVLSGGVRRSATICIFDHDDNEMMNAKTGNWYNENPQRGRSNNSALLIRDNISKIEFEELFNKTKEFGEPGFIFADTDEVVFNPCCISDNNLIFTENGISSPKSCLGEKIEIINNSELHKSHRKGFWETGVKKVYNLELENGLKLEATDDHLIETKKGFKKLNELNKKDEIVLINNSSYEFQIDKNSNDFKLGYFSVEENNDDETVITKTKIIKKETLIGSWNYVSGIISNIFNETAIVENNKISLLLEEIETLESIQSALFGFGINSKLNKNELQISENSNKQFVKCIMFNKFLNTDIKEETNWMSKLSKISEIGKKEVYDINIPSISKFSANGISIHNCEIGFIPRCPYTDESGWSMCNLTEINGVKAKTVEEFNDACKAASILGTLQAGYTKFNYLSEATKRIVEYEALLGVSITGFMDNPQILLNEEILNTGANIVKETNKRIANLLGIRQAARTTCVKPSGNASVILGTTSGIHPEHSKKYFRVMQINKQTELAKYISENYPDLIEESVWSSNNTDYVIYVPVTSEPNSIYKDQVKGVKLLENVKKVQNSWVETGTNPELGIEPYIRHNVSNTVTVDNWDEVGNFLYENRKYFAGVSFLSDIGDKIYAQAPFTSVLTAEEIVETYGSAAMLASGLIVDGLNAFYNNLWKACEYVKSNEIQLEGTRTQILIQKDWIKRAKSFANKYFKSIDDMILCLKDVYLLHKWLNINKSLKHDINFSEIPFKPEFTEIDTMAAMACSGGACEIRSI